MKSESVFRVTGGKKKYYKCISREKLSDYESLTIDDSWINCRETLLNSYFFNRTLKFLHHIRVPYYPHSLQFILYSSQKWYSMYQKINEKKKVSQLYLSGEAEEEKRKIISSMTRIKSLMQWKIYQSNKKNFLKEIYKSQSSSLSLIHVVKIDMNIKHKLSFFFAGMYVFPFSTSYTGNTKVLTNASTDKYKKIYISSRHMYMYSSSVSYSYGQKTFFKLRSTTRCIIDEMKVK